MKVRYTQIVEMLTNHPKNMFWTSTGITWGTSVGLIEASRAVTVPREARARGF